MFDHVRDVRIPSQKKRMFVGSVSFVYAGTVNMILMKWNARYICGARVLIKTYRLKSNSFDRFRIIAITIHEIV